MIEKLSWNWSLIDYHWIPVILRFLGNRKTENTSLHDLRNALIFKVPSQKIGNLLFQQVIALLRETETVDIRSGVVTPGVSGNTVEVKKHLKRISGEIDILPVPHREKPDEKENPSTGVGGTHRIAKDPGFRNHAHFKKWIEFITYIENGERWGDNFPDSQSNHRRKENLLESLFELPSFHSRLEDLTFGVKPSSFPETTVPFSGYPSQQKNRLLLSQNGFSLYSLKKLILSIRTLLRSFFDVSPEESSIPDKGKMLLMRDFWISRGFPIKSRKFWEKLWNHMEFSTRAGNHFLYFRDNMRNPTFSPFSFEPTLFQENPFRESPFFWLRGTISGVTLGEAYSSTVKILQSLKNPRTRLDTEENCADLLEKTSQLSSRDPFELSKLEENLREITRVKLNTAKIQEESTFFRETRRLHHFQPPVDRIYWTHLSKKIRETYTYSAFSLIMEELSALEKTLQLKKEKLAERKLKDLEKLTSRTIKLRNYLRRGEYGDRKKTQQLPSPENPHQSD